MSTCLVGMDRIYDIAGYPAILLKVYQFLYVQLKENCNFRGQNIETFIILTFFSSASISCFFLGGGLYPKIAKLDAFGPTLIFRDKV